MKDMKAMARPFLALYAMALVIALLGRIGLAVAGGTGVLAFDYISASGVPVLDVICSILTGSAFVAFLFAAGLALCVSTAGAVLYGALALAGAGRCGRSRGAPAPADGVSLGLGDGARGAGVSGRGGARHPVGGAGGIHVLEAAGAADHRRRRHRVRGFPRHASGGGLHGGVRLRGSLAHRAQPGAFAHRGGGVVRRRRRSAHGRHVLGPERGEHQPAGAGRLVRGGCRGKCGHASSVRRSMRTR